MILDFSRARYRRQSFGMVTPSYQRAWVGVSLTQSALAFVLDMTTRINVYLEDLYGVSATSDNTTLVRRRLDAIGGDGTAALKRIIDDATSSMS